MSMIVSWNVRGMNKEARHKEVEAYINTMNVPVVGLLETRVKQNKMAHIRQKFGN